MRRFSLLILLVAVGGFIGGARNATAQSERETTPVERDRSATDRALAELATAYEGLAGLFNQGSSEAVDRVQEDMENLGDWEYRIVELPNGAAQSQEQALNEFGNERWEVYWVAPLPDSVRFYLKRPSISYLSRVPLSTLVRLLAGAGQ